MNINVELLTHTPNPTRAMGMPAALCYRKVGIRDLWKNLPYEDCERLVKQVIATGHHSVLEHATFQFGVEGVSRNFSHQMVRHRNTSYEQQSLHYIVADDEFQVATPPQLNKDGRAVWNRYVKKSFLYYGRMVETGIPREEARHILPSGIETKLVMTANLRQWLHFIKIRACDVNCQEILVAALKIKKHLERLMPYLKEHLGPPCHTDKVCPEGKKYCGHPWKLPCTITGLKNGPVTVNEKGLLCMNCKGRKLIKSEFVKEGQKEFGHNCPRCKGTGLEPDNA